jgi:hypothetical protein
LQFSIQFSFAYALRVYPLLIINQQIAGEENSYGMKNLRIPRKYYLHLSIIPFIIIASEVSKRSFAQKDLSIGWRHISIDASLPGDSYGTGAFSLADYDRDGDLDITISRREIDGGRVYWYKYSNGNWQRQ